MTTALVIAAVYFVAIVLILLFVHGSAEVPQDVDL